MIKRKYEAVGSLKNPVSINVPFEIRSTKKYLVVNLTGMPDKDEGSFYVSGKAIPKTRYLDSFGSGILYEKIGNDFYNEKYGFISQLTYTGPKAKNLVENITIGETDKFDFSYYGSLGNIDVVAKILDKEQNTTFIGETTGTQSKANFIKSAKDMVGSYWDVDQGWDFISYISAKANASLPISSSMIDSDAESNGIWQLKYDGSKDVGKWQDIVQPGDVLLLSSMDEMDSSASIVTDIKNGIKVINTVVSNNLKDGYVKILSEHDITKESVYDTKYNYNTLVYSMNTKEAPISTGNTKTTYNADNIIVESYETLGVAKNPVGQYTKLKVDPIPDLTYGYGERFDYYVPITFYPESKYQWEDINVSFGTLPSWLRYDKAKDVLYGTAPSSERTYPITIYGTLGSVAEKDTFNIIVTKKKVVDIQNVVWDAGFKHEININKMNDLPYKITSDDPIKWLKVDQDKDILYGVPPIGTIGDRIKVTVYQEENRQHINEDSFEILVTTPISLIGSNFNYDN